jgi:predicted nucleic acid-binding protein
MKQSYVLDPSILIQAYVADTDTARVQTLLAGLEHAEPDAFHIPDFCLLECTNIVWKRVRFHGMPVAQAKHAIEDLLALPLARHASAVFLMRAFEIGVSHQIAIYDSVYIALAEWLHLPLITADVKQSTVASAAGVTVKPITDFSPFGESSSTAL